MNAIEDTAAPVMSNFVSRVIVAIVGLPLVLGLIWLGGWWLFGLVAAGAFVAVHEFVTTARQLRPLSPAVYLGVLLALVGAESGKVEWLLGGFVATFVLAFLLNAAAETRAPTTAAVGSTVLGSAWIGLGLGSLLVLREMHTEARLIAFTVVVTVFAADTAAYLAGRLAGRHLLAPRLSPKKTWEGFVAGAIVGIFACFVALYDARDHHYLSRPEALVLGAAVVAAAVVGDLFESALKRDLDVKDTGRLLGGHGGVLHRARLRLSLMPAEQVSEHVWWFPPGPPDRPSLCAVVGDRWTLALDAGSSRAHTQEFLAGLPARPAAVAYTHSHWDHVFGGVEIGGLVIAHTLTAQRLGEMALRDWNDEPNISEHIREELPAPRVVEIAPADVVFEERVELDLGGVRVSVEHVGGDHCDDACVMFVEPDALLFLGDCLCASPREEKLTVERALPLYDRVLSYPAELYVEGHHPAVSTRAELEALIEKARAASRGEATPGDEDSEYYLAAFVH